MKKAGQMVLIFTALFALLTFFIHLHSTASNETIEKPNDNYLTSDSTIHQRIKILQRELILLQKQFKLKNNSSQSCATKPLEPPKMSISLEPMVTAGEMKLSSAANKWGIPMANSTLTDCLFRSNLVWI